MVQTTFAAERLVDGRFDLGLVHNAPLELSRGNPRLIWGWKRNVGPAFRIVYFAGELTSDGQRAILDRWYLFYRHRASSSSILAIADFLAACSKAGVPSSALRVEQIANGQADLRFELGTADSSDRDRVHRLQLRRPRRRLPDVVLPIPLDLAQAASLGAADVYVGSGLSYEAGLPTLCDMHAAFGVDNHAQTQFAVGEDDTLPFRLAHDFAGTIASFCAVHVEALRAAPTRAMRAIAELKDKQVIRKVFTDNVDNLLAKVSVPFERTRGSGVFNEPYPATFASDRLIVVGVAADRRSIVRRARARGLEIVVVNPCQRVAPMVRHLDYIRKTDRFFQVSADAFFSRWAGAEISGLAQASAASEAQT